MEEKFLKDYNGSSRVGIKGNFMSTKNTREEGCEKNGSYIKITDHWRMERKKMKLEIEED